MNIVKTILAVCGAGMLLAPAVGNAAVVFDQVKLESSTQVTVNGATKASDPKHTYYSLGAVQTGVTLAANSLSIKSAGAAQAANTSLANFSSASSGSYGIFQDAATSVSKKTATSSAQAFGMVNYVFTITGASIYNLSIDGQAIGSAVGSSITGVFDTWLWDDTTNSYLFQNKIGPGDSFSTLIKGLGPGVYELGSANWDDVYSASKGCGCTSGAAGDAAAFNFNLSAVPEPGQWALMVLGIGLIGAALRASGRVERKLDALRA